MTGSLDSLCQAQASLVREYIEGSAVFEKWEAPRQELIARFTAEPAWMLALPMLCCQAAGGEVEAALPVAAAWLCLRHAAHLMDSVADMPTNIKLKSGIAAGLIFAGFQFVTETAESKAVSRILSQFTQAGFSSAFGQRIFLSTDDSPTSDPLERYWQAVILKSGSIFRAGAASGAALASPRQDLTEMLGDYGSTLGVMLQILDDCRDRFEDQDGGASVPGLPALLQNLLPESSEQALPETLSRILQEWQNRAIHAIAGLPDSPALAVLRQIPGMILEPAASKN